MDSLAPPNGPTRKRWRARVKLNYQEYFLGYFVSKDEAIKAEQDFRRRVNG